MQEVIKDSPTFSMEDAHKESVDVVDVVEYMEEQYPQMTEEFKKIQREQYELFLHKQQI